MTRKILIIEDEKDLLAAYQKNLEASGLTVLMATNLLDALESLEANPDIRLIAVDGCFPRTEGENATPEPGRLCSGEKFIANSRYHGPIIACSSEETFNKRMVSAGATHSSGKGHLLCNLIRQILNLPAVT
jgi:CheY-like chemotaxis protein